MSKRLLSVVLSALLCLGIVEAQNRYELNSGWRCMPSTKTKDGGEKISEASYAISKWKKAVVPGTVLTTMLENGEIPDPFYGMNNEKIPDIYDTGRDYYTYWFAKDFKETAKDGEQVWLTFRGINYSCDIFLNGKKVNQEPFVGMFLRKSFNVTGLLAKDGNNRLAVIVHPVDPVGEPNGGQGGDGVIARNLSHQYVAGWDWIQPIRDRNTGIWDKVYIEKTGSVNIKNPHVVTLVEGIRNPKDKTQADATLKVSTELQNATNKKVSGTLRYTLDGQTVSQKVSIDANSNTEVNLPDYTIKNPKLWWPSGYGEQNMYSLKLEFVEDGTTRASDNEEVNFGVRELQFDWNSHTRSRQISVNGQKIFIKGGNWIISDAMLRFTNERYDTEIRYHRDMNLNLIRIWGGALTERPEFYEACDKYGMLVIQDFWFSGDCNGRWLDPLKKEDQWTRRQYPNDHRLVLEAAADMIKMIRNYPSLAMWCGGNEIMPPNDILVPLRDELLPKLDGTRWFAEYSNSDEWSYNFLGGNGDGPYTIQPIEVFWDHRTWPFNSEVGSVGVGDYESLERFIPKESMVAPQYDASAKFEEIVDPVWTYHTYSGVGYKNHILPYGAPKDVKDFAVKAQLVNYNQYRALMEGFSSHMWDWYTGSIIWKTQNPWTSMRGQMYDYYLDPNACLFGLRKGSESVHVMCDPTTKMVYLVNNSFEQLRDLMVVMKAYDMDGKETLIDQTFTYMEPSMSKKIQSVSVKADPILKDNGGFIYLQLFDKNKNLLSDNFYWFPNGEGKYSGLNSMKSTTIEMKTKTLSAGKIEVTLSNAVGNPVAFFNRVSLIDAKTGERILPAFYDDNYVSVLPGNSKTIVVEYTPKQEQSLQVEVKGWNVERQTSTVK